MDALKLTSVLLLSFLLSISGFAQRNCGTMEYLDQQIQENPEHALHMHEIEEHTKNILANQSRVVNGVITIPVVVHIVWNVNNPVENISDAQIFSQIDILNEDFRRTNADAVNTPAMFQSVAADSEIEFCLASIDPNGQSTDGIVRKSTTNSSFSSNNNVKFDATGGSNAWPAGDYLNIWVCDLSGGLLGYAQFPGGNPATDGIVCDYQYFGNIGTASPPFDLGRTATHEVGHWLNLRHIWGDGGCGVDDFVSDTPLAGGSNTDGLPCTFPSANSCNSGANDQPDMFQNYMDYSDDACMNIFTFGQRVRMRALFEPGGFRESILNSQVCALTASCNDGIQNGNETGVDCGGPDCPACPTCFDGIQNGNETGVDCGGPDCPACPTCFDGIQNGNETGVDCGGPDCPDCVSCNDGIQNGDEEGVDCGGSNCPPCNTCDDNELTLLINFDLLPSQVSWEVTGAGGVVFASGGPYTNNPGGSSVTENICLPDGCYEFTIYDSGNNGLCCRFGFGNYQLTEDATGNIIASGAQYQSEESTDFCLGNTSGPTCNDGIQNGDEEGVDCGGSNCPPCMTPPTCDDGIQNGDETGVDCGGSNCPACPSCNDGIQNGNETGVDCGGSDCPPCPTCFDGIQNGDEEGVDCGGSNCPPCMTPPTCDDGIQNGDEEGVDCGGSNCPPCMTPPTCDDGIQNGNETGVDCGGPDCPLCDGSCSNELVLTLNFDLLPNQTTWEITNNNGIVLYSGGPYSGSNANNTLTINDICLDDGCYTLTMYDSGNNGMCCRFGFGSYSLTTVSGADLASGGTFAASDATDFCLGGAREISNDKITNPPSWDVYPVPASNILHVQYKLSTDSDVQISLSSLTGHMINQQVYRASAGANMVEIDLGGMAGGVYFIHLTQNGQRYTKRFIVIE